MRPSRMRRKSPGFGYIGSGNKTSVYTRRPKTPFSKIKSIYGEELERLNPTKGEPKSSFRALNEEEKKKIRNKVKEELFAERKKQIIGTVVLVLLIAIIFILIKNYR